LFPSEFRGDFGEEMSTVFRDERAEAAAGGRLGIVRLWWRTLRGFAGTAPREHAHLLIRDAAYGLRLMRKHPLTTGAAMVAIALGVGANTAMFTVVNAVLLQLPFDDPGRLVSVALRGPQGFAAIPVTQFRTWTGRIEAVESLEGYSMYSPVLTGAGAPDRLRLECVSSGMFTMLGVVPALGRGFAHDEDDPGAAPVMVASHAFWASRLGRDPRSIGRVLTLDGTPVSVIGVMPNAFDGPRALRRIDGWIPLTWCLENSRAQGRPAATVSVYARLKDGVTAAQAEAQMVSALEGETSLPKEAVGVQLSPLTDEIYGEVKEPLLALSGAAGFVLLIACANVAGLLIGRADARRRELAVRLALGCSRARMVRQMLTESLLFALCGGAVGLLMANWSLQMLLALMPGWIRRIDHIAIDGSALAACVGFSVATAVVFGLWPALYASRVEPGAALKESALLTTRSHRRMRGALIVGQIALSVALLTGAGLLIKTFLHLRPVDPGFEPGGKLAATISLPHSQYPDGPAWTAFVENLRQRLAQRPDVEAVVAASYLPLSGSISLAEVQHAGTGDSRSVTVYAPHITFDYLAEMGIPILRGRSFTPLDGPGAGVAIVNETMARTMWSGQDALGRQLVVKTLNGTSTKTIVGISRNVRDAGQRLTSRSQLYLSFADEPVPILRLVVTTRHTVEQMAPVIRQEVAAIDPVLPVGEVESVGNMVARSVATWRFAAWLLAVFAGIAAILAAVGLFAVVAGSVTERTPEIGVRMALGAARGNVLRLFLMRGARVTALGTACGLTLAALTTRFLSAWLVDASPLDPPTFAVTAAGMAAVCLLATYLAARRAASIDPLLALRS
jgi:putative ABC transport system permease protein